MMSATEIKNWVIAHPEISATFIAGSALGLIIASLVDPENEA